MNCKRLLNILLIAHCTLFIANCTKAQGKYNNNWVTGGTFNFVINFDSAVARTKYFDTVNHYLGFRGSHSCINDSLGILKLMCNGAKVYNAKGNIIENGDSLIDSKYYTYQGGNTVLAQGSEILLPFDSNIYYLVNVTISDSVWSTSSKYDKIYCHKIEMNANNGDGKVIEKKRVISDSGLYAWVGMSACKHANGKDWWLVKHGAAANDYYTFFISKDSISEIKKQSFAVPIYNTADRSGQLSFNQQATKLAYVQEEPNQVFVADFNRCDGQITNPKIYNIPALLIDSYYSYTALDVNAGGLCFSPNGRFLYVSMISKIFQLDLLEADSNLAWQLIAGLDTTPNSFQLYSNIELGPDNKIYIGHWNAGTTFWNVIDNPDAKGVNCNYCRACLRFPGVGSFSTPNSINYNLGASPTLCHPLDTGNIKIDSIQLYVSYQNTSNQLTISIAKNAENKLDVFSAQGALVYSQAINAGVVKVSVDVSSWAKGVYIVRVGGQSKKVIIN